MCLMTLYALLEFVAGAASHLLSLLSYSTFFLLVEIRHFAYLVHTGKGAFLAAWYLYRTLILVLIKRGLLFIMFKWFYFLLFSILLNVYFSHVFIFCINSS